MVAASSHHPGGVNVLFMDGSVRFIKNSVNFQAWYAIATVRRRRGRQRRCLLMRARDRSILRSRHDPAVPGLPPRAWCRRVVYRG